MRPAACPGSGHRACSSWAAAPSCARSRRPRTCWRPSTGSPRTSGAAPASPSSAATPSPRTGGTSCTPATQRRTSWVTAQLSGRPAGPVVAATDYMRAFAEQIRPSVPSDRRYVVLGTDGFGRSDYRKALRRHFEVDRHHVVVATLAALAAEGTVPGECGHRRHRPLRHRSRQARPGSRLSSAHRPSPARSRQVGEEAPCPPRSWSPTSATSATCRSSRCTSPPVTRSTPRTRC